MRPCGPEEKVQPGLDSDYEQTDQNSDLAGSLSDTEYVSTLCT